MEDEDEDTFAYSVRISSQDLLMALSEEFEQECCASLAQVCFYYLEFYVFSIHFIFRLLSGMFEKLLRHAVKARRNGGR